MKMKNEPPKVAARVKDRQEAVKMKDNHKEATMGKKGKAVPKERMKEPRESASPKGVTSQTQNKPKKRNVKVTNSMSNY